MQLSACSDSTHPGELSTSVDESTDISIVIDSEFEATDWTEATHNNNVDPNIEEVFDDTMVKGFDFVVTSERWQSMLDNMTETYGEFGHSIEVDSLNYDYCSAAFW